MIDSEGGEKRHGGGSATGFILININEKDRKKASNLARYTPKYNLWKVSFGFYRQRISECAKINY